MNTELLMDLDDCGSPEKLLGVILKHHPDWTAPVPVEALATSVNIVEFRELEADGFEGALLTDAAAEEKDGYTRLDFQTGVVSRRGRAGK
jgi:hypothetical protein